MGFLESIYKIEPQLASQWELSFDDSTDIVYKVQDVTLPSYQLTVETKHTGQKVYKALEEPGNITMTIREDVDFGTYNFFYTWFTSVYDLTKRVFKKQQSIKTNLKSAKLIFLRNNPTALNTPRTGNIPDNLSPGFTIDTTSVEFDLIDCKIVGIDSLSLDYSGNPLLFSVTIIPEEIKFKKII
jgi:hypothetical protein